MDYSQLELFQIPNEYENNIFERAKKLKTIVQEAYSQVRLSGNNSVVLEDYAIINVKVKINHIREGESVIEPTSPKMFIWQFTPLITIKTNEVEKTIVSTKNSMKNVPTKIIPKWINEYFTIENNSFLKSEFLLLAKQYYTLELLNDVLSNEDIVKRIFDIVGQRQLLIYINSKLFANIKNDSPSLHERDVVNRVKNFYAKLRKFKRKDCYIIGYYDDFINENQLLIQLDNNKYIQDQIEKSLGKIKPSENLCASYQNDYLFLNNSEFIEVRHNTADWDCNFIVTPFILNSSFNGFGFSDLKKRIEWNNSREIFCYIRRGGGEYFVRNEILFPDKKIEINKLEEILILSPEYQNG